MTDAPHLPGRLSFEIGGFGGPWHRVRWRRGILVHETGDFGSTDAVTSEMTPTLEQWQTFWSEVEKAEVWKWRRDYTRPVLDGTSWSLKLTHDGRAIHSGGSNGYPGSDTEDHEPGCAFDIFLQALMLLTGGNWYHDALE